MAQDFTHPNAQPFALEAGENAILLIHGFTGSPSHMRFIGEAACKAGFSAHGILLPGHGRTIEEMVKSNDTEWWEACKDTYREMSRKYKNVTVSGLSMGGLLALLLAEAFEPPGVIAFAPAIRYRQAVNHLSPLAKRLVKVSGWKDLTYAPEDFLRDYDFGYLGAPVAKVEDMTRLQRTARKGLSKITCPILVVQSHKDESVHRTGPEIITRGVASTVKEIAWVDRSPHVCTIGPDREYVVSRVVDFLCRYGV